MENEVKRPEREENGIAENSAGQTSLVRDTESKIIECLEKLKDSPLKDENFRNDLMNLCGAIVSIIEHLSYMIDTPTGGDVCYVGVEYIKKRLFQIYTLSDVIKEKINTDDFVEIDNLLYYYRKQKDKTL